MLFLLFSTLKFLSIKMIRYYGFLSMRRRGEALPRVYAALGMTIEEEGVVD